MRTHDAVIVGAGPTGMMLAGELRLAGVDVLIVERREGRDFGGARAGGLHARTIEVLDQRGIAERFLRAGQIAQVNAYASVKLDISDFPSRHPYGLGLWQNEIERLLGEWMSELQVPISRGRAVTGFVSDDDGVDVALDDGSSLRAQYLVGCDGGRSLVRKAARIEFPGWDPTTSALIAVVEMRETPPLGMRRDARGVHGIGKLDYKIVDGEIVWGEGGPLRVMISEELGNAEERLREPMLDDVSRGLVSVYGTDFGVHSPTSISRFTDMTRQAAAYRAGRILLAGDAAHVHSPVGGQGLNTGVQDAANLGWKLALVVKGSAPDGLLDTYHAERHPIGARVLKHTMAQVALMRSDERVDALRESVQQMLSVDETRKRFGGMMSGLDIRYELGEGHPLVGRRMPDLDLVTVHGATRAYSLLHQARPVVLNFGDAGALDVAPWSDRVSSIDAQYDGAWELPVIGTVAAPSAVLVRPDGYVAWVGERSNAGLVDALTKWLGPPAA